MLELELVNVKKEIRTHMRKSKSAGFFDQIDLMGREVPSGDRMPSSIQLSDDLLHKFNQLSDDHLKVAL